MLGPFAWLGLRWPRLLPLLFIGLGAAWATYTASDLLSQRVPPELEKKTVTITGVVASLPVRHHNSTRFDFQIEQASVRGQHVALPKRVRLSSYRYRGTLPWQPAAGSRWQIKVRLKNPYGFRNPGGFDYEAHLFSNRIRATGYVVQKSTPVYLGDGGWRYSLLRLRESIARRVRERLPGNSQQGVITALSVGDRQGLDSDAWTLLQHTGTAHLVAISGLHLSLVSGLVFFLARFGWSCNEYLVKRMAAQKAAAIVALASAAFYAGLAGFAIPTQRAVVMLAVVYTALYFAYRPLRSQVLALALLAVLIFDPLSVLSASFWLSFTAVTIIIFVTQSSTGHGGWLAGMRLQLAVSLGLIPLTILFFQNASFVSPLANLVAIPVYGLLVVPLSLVSLMLPDAVATPALGLAAWVSSLGWEWLQVLDTWLPLHAQLGGGGVVAAVLAIGGLVILALPTGTPARWLGAFWCLPLLWSPAAPEPGQFRATLLDVGQGLSLVVQTANHALLYDAGARFSETFNAGDAVVLPFLRQDGIGKLDMLIISHGDNDHIGGLEAVRRQFTVNTVLSNANKARADEACIAGKHWAWDGVRFEILHPRFPDQEKHNNRSCVLKVSTEETSLLATGDIEREAERALIERQPERIHATYLVAPHHGSNTSSTREFIEAVRPQWILVPAGHLNRYRHPALKVTRRYDQLGITWMVSGESGAIEIDSSTGMERPSRYRQQHLRYWHTRSAEPGR